MEFGSVKKFELKSGDVHIWSASLLDENNINYFYSILSADERKRADSFKFFKDQRKFILARGILRCLLSKYLRQSLENIEILYGLWGKPCLLEDKLKFNVSHSGDYALYAFTLQNEVGIDIEYINKNLELNDIAPSIFSSEELSGWKGLDRENRIRTFFERWVSKEALLKALGKGWLEDKEDLHSYFNNKLRTGNLYNELTNPYCFDCIPGYASALFVNRALLRPFYYVWDQNSSSDYG